MVVQKKLEEEAEKLIAKYEVTGPPVDVEGLARREGARVAFDNFEQDLSGLLYRDGTTIVIAVNSTHSRTRQRFTIAHEIGHLKLHSEQTMFVDRTFKTFKRDSDASAGIDKKEIQANGFAAALLMPQVFVLDEVKRQWSAGVSNAEWLIQNAANKFVVSPQALGNRLSNLGIAMPTQ